MYIKSIKVNGVPCSSFVVSNPYYLKIDGEMVVIRKDTILLEVNGKIFRDIYSLMNWLDQNRKDIDNLCVWMDGCSHYGVFIPNILDTDFRKCLSFENILFDDADWYLKISCSDICDTFVVYNGQPVRLLDFFIDHNITQGAIFAPNDYSIMNMSGIKVRIKDRGKYMKLIAKRRMVMG